MSIQFKRGNTDANDSYTGLNAELTIDFEGETIRVHDGSTAGGAFSVGISDVGDGSTDLSVNYATDSFTITSSTGTNTTVDAATSTQAGAMSAADKDKLDGLELASTIEAEGATNNSALMTPLRVSELLASGNFNIDFGEI